MAPPVEVHRKLRQLDNDVQSIYETLATIAGTQMRHGNRLDELGTMLNEHSHKLDEHSHKLDEHSHKLDEHSDKLDEHSDKLDRIDVKLDTVIGMLGDGTG